MAERMFLGLREVAEVLGLSHSTVYKRVREGVIPSVRIGQCWRVPRKWLEGLLDERVLGCE